MIKKSERRLERRYPIELELQHRKLQGGKVVVSGEGRTCNLSSGGILFHTGDLLNPGARMQLSIHWPVKLENACGLKLMVEGRVVRSTTEGTAIRIERYEFRTRARYDQSAIRLPVYAEKVGKYATV